MGYKNFIKSVKPNLNGAIKQGYYTLINSAKYVGDQKLVIYRSSLEYRMCYVLDTTDSVIKWTIEPPIPLKYYDPIKRKFRTYYPDFYCEMNSKNGILKFILEIKPDSFIPKNIKNLPSNATRSQMRSYNMRVERMIINNAKWHAANAYCKQNGMKYMFINEEFFKNFKISTVTA